MQPINSAVDTYGRIFALDYSTNSVKVFTADELEDEVFSFGHGILNLNQHGSVMPDIKILSADLVEVEDEVVMAADAENTEKTFTFTLANNNLVASFIEVTDGVETFTFANDELTGSEGGTGTFNVYAGTVTVTFNAAPTAEVTASYKHHGADKIFVSDSFNHCVRVFNLNGVLQATIGSHGTANGKFNLPSGLELNADKSQLHVVDSYNHRVSVFNASTYAFVQNYGSLGHLATSGVYYPTDIAVSTTNSYVTDTGHNRIVKFVFSDGSWAEASSGYVVKDFKAIENSNRLAVLGLVANVGKTGFHCTDTFISVIQNFNDSWVKQDDDSTTGHTAGKTFLPRGLSFSGNTNLVVCDTGNSRLQILDLS